MSIRVFIVYSVQYSVCIFTCMYLCVCANPADIVVDAYIRINSESIPEMSKIYSKYLKKNAKKMVM